MPEETAGETLWRVHREALAARDAIVKRMALDRIAASARALRDVQIECVRLANAETTLAECALRVESGQVDARDIDDAIDAVRAAMRAVAGKCATCGHVIEADEQWDRGRSGGPEHAGCNRKMP